MNTHKSEEKRPYNFDEDRMVNEGLAGGEVDPQYDEPAIDESRPLKKDIKPKK